MSRPGYNITLKAGSTPSGLGTDIGQLFIAGLADQGSTTRPTKVTSINDFVAKCGPRQTYSGLYDYLDAFFSVGGRVAWICRVVGPAAVNASLVLQDTAGTPANTMTVRAKSPGAWGNNLRIVVAAAGGGSQYQITVKDASGNTLEISPVFSDKPSAIQWATVTSKYITLSDTGPSTLIPAPLTSTPLASGADDRASITSVHKKAALDTATSDYGPGHVIIADDTSTAGAQAAAAHAAAHNRLALPYIADLPATGVASPADAIISALRTDGTDDSALLPFANWASIPGVLPNTYRVVPWAVIQAGLYARNDAAGFGANAAAAGDQGITTYPIALTQNEPALDPSTLIADATVAIASGAGSPQSFQTYGDRTCVDPAGIKAVNLGAANARLRMAIIAQFGAILARYVFKGIDAKNHVLEQCANQLRAVLGRFYSDDALYGETPQDAYDVEVAAINNPNTANQRILQAAASYKPTPNSEEVDLTVNVVPTTGSVAA